jgi:Transglutaminase-like superfamily
MITGLRKLVSLDRDRRRLLAEAVVVHAAMNVLVRVTPWWIRKPIAAPPDRRPLTIASVSWAVQTAAARLPGTTCLTSALTARLMLKRRGHHALIRFGVACPRDPRDTPMFHAWAECDGRTVIGAESLESYRALESCSATAARIANSTAFAGR